jgi:hypothetical protein
MFKNNVYFLTKSHGVAKTLAPFNILSMKDYTGDSGCNIELVPDGINRHTDGTTGFSRVRLS